MYTYLYERVNACMHVCVYVLEFFYENVGDGRSAVAGPLDRLIR